MAMNITDQHIESERKVAQEQAIADRYGVTRMTVRKAWAPASFRGRA